MGLSEAAALLSVLSLRSESQVDEKPLLRFTHELVISTEAYPISPCIPLAVVSTSRRLLPPLLLPHGLLQLGLLACSYRRHFVPVDRRNRPTPPQ